MCNTEKRTETIAQSVSRFVLNLTYQDLPDEIKHLTKRFILDNIGCILGGGREESSREIAAVAKLMGGNPQSTVIGFNFKTSVLNAAMTNGTTGHALELDDDHRVGTQHPGVEVIPTALAVGEYVNASGEEIIAAVCAGCEIAIRVGEAFVGDAYYQGFHPTGTCGVFGAAVAAGKLLKLTEEQMANALGIAGSQSSGLREWKASGAWTKRFQAGHANFAGTVAAFMAKEGYTGPLTIFEGTYGVLRAYSYQLHYDETLILKDLGHKYEMADTSIKPHACCRFCQPLVDAALAVVNEYDLWPQDIKSIRIGTGKNTLIALTKPAERKWHPQTGVDAQFSLPFSIAVAITRRVALAEEFTEKYFKDPEILSFMERIDGYLDEEVEACWPDSYPAVAIVETYDGRTLRGKIDFPKGDPENPVTDEELVAKFKYLTGDCLDPEKAAAVIDIVMSLEKLDDTAKLLELLTGK